MLEVLERVKTWEKLSYMLGRNDLPARLFDCYYAGLLDDVDEVARALEDAWTSAEWPERNMDRDCWLPIFDSVGYLEGDKTAERPTEPIRLYRGSPEEFKSNMAWSDSLETARWFADRSTDVFRIPAVVWTVLAPPISLLAHFPGSRDEGEYVVDTTGLDVSSAGPVMIEATE